MKALTMTLVAALTLMATTSHAAFCAKKYANELVRGSNKGNFFNQQLAKNSSSTSSSQSASTPVQSEN